MMALGPESSEQKLGDAAGSGPGGPCLADGLDEGL